MAVQLTLPFFVSCSLIVCACGFNQTYPTNVTVSSNAITDVSLLCSGVQLEWRKNGTKLNLGNPPAGINVKVVGGQQVTQTLTIQKASVLNYNGTSFKCSHGGENFNSVPTAFIIVYGKYFLLANYIYVTDRFATAGPI